MECIGNSDALYHDIEHTMLVTLVGHDILSAARWLVPPRPMTTSTSFWPASPMTSDTSAASSKATRMTPLSQTSAVGKFSCRWDRQTQRLAPYHVDRSKLFVIERFDAVDGVDAARIAKAIEYTRFPYATTPKADTDDLNEEEGLLLRAADLIGQLGDPNYIRKSNALFHEFEGNRADKKLGYATPADIVYNFHSSIGPMWHRRSSMRSAISMSRPAAGSGSPISTAMFSG